MKQQIINEQMDAVLEFWRYSDSINGRNWLYNSTIWMHGGGLKERDHGNSLGVLVYYVQERLMRGCIPQSMIENSFYTVYNDRVKRAEFIAFLEMVMKMRIEQN